MSEREHSDEHDTSGEAPALGSARARVRRLLKNTSIYAAGDIVVALLSVALLPLISHALTPDESGVWFLATMVFSGFVFLCNPALDSAVRRFFFDHEHDEAHKRRFQGTVTVALLGWSLLVCLITTALGPWLFDALFLELPFWPYGALVVWMVFLSLLGAIPRAVWYANEQPTSFVAVKLLGSGTEVLGQLALVMFAGVGVLGMFYGRAFSLVVLAVPFTIYLIRHVRAAWSWNDLRSALRFSLPLVPHLAAHWVLGMSDRFLIERHYAHVEAAGGVPEADFGVAAEASISLAAVGIYGYAYEFLRIVNLVAMSMNQAWVPQFTRAHGRLEERGFVSRSITYFILAVGSMSAAVIVLGPTLARLVLDAKYAHVADLVPILAFGGLFQGLYYVFVAILFFYKSNRLMPVVTIISGVVNVVLNLLWLPKWGLVGVCWATVIGYAILMFGMWWAAARHPMPGFETGRLAKISVVLVAVSLAGLALDDWHGVWVDLAVDLVLLGLGALLLWMLGVGHETKRPRRVDSHPSPVEDAPQ